MHIASALRSTLALALLWTFASATVVAREDRPERVAYNLSGTIGDLPVRMRLVRTGGTLSGTYVYESSKTALHAVVNALNLSGRVDARGRFSLDETANDWERESRTGRVEGTLLVEGGAARATGTWSKPDGSRRLPFAVSEPRSGPSGSRVVTRRWSETDPQLKSVVDASYPVFEGSNDPQLAALNAAVERTVADLVAEFKNGVAEDSPIPEELLGRLAFELTYEVTAATPDLVSILFSSYVNYGGAHPSAFATTLTFDVRRGKPLVLAELFKDRRGYLRLLASKTATVVERDLRDSLNPTPDAESYGTWYLTPNGLTVVFSVAHVLGDTVEVYVPFGELRAALDPTSPVGSLLK